MKKLLFAIMGLGILAGCAVTTDSQVVTGDGSNIAMDCRKPYEEVSKIRIGCPVDASKLTKIGTDENGVEMYSAKLPDSFFESVKIKVIDGNIEGASFDRSYRNVLSSDIDKEMRSLREALQKRWGKDTPFNLDGRTRVDSYSFRKPNSKVLSHVMATKMTEGSIGIIGVNYTSKKLQAHEKRVADNENAQRVRSFKGL